jgi:hypothetical protein
MCLRFLERFWWAGFNGIYLIIQNVGDIDFKVISAAENSNKFQKTKISWGYGNTWANGTDHTSNLLN